METRGRISGRALRAAALGAAFVVLGIVMIVLGWPEGEEWQTMLLQLSGVMFALAVAVAIWHMVGERDLMRNPTRNFRLVRLVTIIGVALGAVFYVLAFALRQFSLAPLGQFCIWVGLGAMFAYLAAGSVRHEFTERVVWRELDGEDLDDDVEIDVLGELQGDPLEDGSPDPQDVPATDDGSAWTVLGHDDDTPRPRRALD